MRAKLLSNGSCSVRLVADVPTVPNPSHGGVWFNLYRSTFQRYLFDMYSFD